MFTLTDAAARQIQHAAEAGGATALALRIAARVDATGERHYGMGFDDPKDEDMKLDLYGVAVVIAEQYQDVLNDTVLDFVELEPGAFNFIFMDGRQAEAAPAPPTGGSCGGGACAGGGCASGQAVPH